MNVPTLTKRIALYSAVAGALLGLAQGVAAQQGYPVRPVRLIASQSPGGGIDTVARIIAARLGEALGQNVIVDNRPGANGTLAGDLTAKSPPDGYTIMLGAVGNLGVNEFFMKRMPYRPLRDLAAVTPVIESGSVLVVHPSLPVKSVRDLLALARARPGDIAYGSSGIGGSGYLAAGLLQSMTRIKLLHVPYRGSGPAIVNLIAGEVQMSLSSPASTAGGIKSGRLRALAVSTAKRLKNLPDLPTIAEAGVPGYESKTWYGLVVAAKTPKEIVARLNREIVQILNRPDVQQALKIQGEVWTATPEEFGAFIRSEHDKWGRIIKEMGISAN